MTGSYRNLCPMLSGLVTAVVVGLAGCGDSTGPDEAVQLEFELRADPSGWEADFTDFPRGRDEDVGFEAGVRELPDPLDGQALYHRGFNISDDLFMYFRRRVSGLAPGGRYRAEFGIELASDIGQGCDVGVGNNVVKAGAAGEEPVRRIDENGDVRLSVDKGSQSNSGANALVLGDIRNGLPGCGDDVPFATRALEGGGTITVSADDSGGLWLFFGSESVFETAHELYFTELTVTLERLGA